MNINSVLIKSNHVLADIPCGVLISCVADTEVYMENIIFRRARIMALSAGHCVNDWYMNFVQVLIPFFIMSGFPIGKSAFLVTAFTCTSSVMQPLFGIIVDRTDRRWMIIAGTAWMAALLSLTGLVRGYPLLFAVVLLSGFGTAAFHPQASAMVASLSGGKRGFWQAFFIASGNLGWALAPLIIVPFVTAFGLGATPYLAIPGVLTAAVLALVSRGVKKTVRARNDRRAIFPAGSVLPLSRIVFIVMCRSLTYFGMVAFLPIYLSEKGFSIGRSGNLLFLMLAAGAAGGLIGGFISDRWSRRGVLSVSLLLAAVFFMLFLRSSGTLSLVLLGLAGACLLGSFSVTVVMAQTILTHGAATASGLMLGLGTGIGGLGVGILGHAAGVYGAGRVVMVLALVPAAAGIVSLTLGTSYEKDTSKSNTMDALDKKSVQGSGGLPDAPNGLNER